MMDHLHWWYLLAKPSATATRDSHVAVLALATLGDVTQIGSFLSLSLHSRWPRQVEVCRCQVLLLPGLSGYLRQCQWSIINTTPPPNKLECSSLTIFFSLVQYFLVARATRTMRHSLKKEKSFIISSTVWMPSWAELPYCPASSARPEKTR
jgi:hypothetical protein